VADAHEAPGVDARRPDHFLSVCLEQLRDPAEGARAEAFRAGLRGQELLGEVLFGGWREGWERLKRERERKVREKVEVEEEEKEGKKPKKERREKKQTNSQ
jgi:hypothetical protein